MPGQDLWAERCAILYMCMLYLCHQSDLGVAAKSVPRQSHPFLYFNKHDVKRLQDGALTTHAHIYADLKEAVAEIMIRKYGHITPKTYQEFGSKWNEIYGNSLPPLALFSVLNPEDKAVFYTLLESLDNMAKQPTWVTIQAPEDEVPLAHSLVGFSTAVDFIFPRLEPKRQDAYIKKIVNETQKMYNLSKQRWWGTVLLQNHVATNLVALLTGALMTRKYTPTAEKWISDTIQQFDKTMTFLDQTHDGSLDEGVAYGSYTARSITQYCFLLKRHLDIDHHNNKWLRSHFWFYYSTVYPGYQRTVGIADSNINWFYGPGSQLVYLDTFVMKNGNGNWLANQIRNARNMTRKQSRSQKVCTIHTEYIWFDPHLSPEPPLFHNTPQMYIFEAWGVITYSTGLDDPQRDTFLSFKSGKIHGETVYDHVHKAPDENPIKASIHFNPGHEHPDKNSFTYFHNGNLVISEGLYGTKLSYLDNVLMFHPSDVSPCTGSWGGQLGDCERWLQWRKKVEQTYNRGDIISSSVNKDMVHIAGESVNAYHPSLKLSSVYRNLILVKPDLLFIMDHVEKRKGSKITHTSTFFNNYLNKFIGVCNLGIECDSAIIDTGGDTFRIQWMAETSKGTESTIKTFPSNTASNHNRIHNLNVTFELPDDINRMAYIIHSSQVTINSMNIIESTGSYIVWEINTSSGVYIISVITDYTNAQKRNGMPNSLASVEYDGATTIFQNQYKSAVRLFSNDTDISRDSSSFPSPITEHIVTTETQEVKFENADDVVVDGPGERKPLSKSNRNNGDIGETGNPNPSTIFVIIIVSLGASGILLVYKMLFGRSRDSRSDVSKYVIIVASMTIVFYILDIY
ncbi:unnamed protein product [Owenia fusiformis]|uniref:Uncharacterized protein n=1 Tax=Owenia fusiformis TaxID=6347 RepID=A0A8J1XFZ6_OWEFU|nr:unnamed protein product [Owenia fusiformis]